MREKADETVARDMLAALSATLANNRKLRINTIYFQLFTTRRLKRSVGVGESVFTDG